MTVRQHLFARRLFAAAWSGAGARAADAGGDATRLLVSAHAGSGLLPGLFGIRTV